MSAKHLLKQMKKSISFDDACMYRGPDDTMCAAGVFLSDAEVQKVGNAGAGWAIVTIKLGVTPHDDLISSLQTIHDCYSVEDWSDKLRALAERRELEMVT